MTDVIVKYFYQNGKDTTQNLVIFPSHTYKIANVKDLILEFLKHKLACSNCHFRFKDSLEGNIAWVDIKNANVPLPINKMNEVEIKILKLPMNANLQLNSATNVHDDLSIPQKKSNEQPKEENIHQHSKNHKQENIFPNKLNEWSFPDQKPSNKETTWNVKKTTFPVEKGSDEKQHQSQKPNKSPETFQEAHKKPFSQTNTHPNEKDLDDFFGSNPKKATSHSYESLKKSDSPQKIFKTSTKVPEKNISDEQDDMLGLNIGDYVAKTSYTDVKQNEASRQRQKIECSNYIDPKIKDWAYKNNIQKDLRFLLTTLHEVMPENDNNWKKVELQDILTEGALRKVALSAIINLHPDKHPEAEPMRQYSYQRIVEEVNKAFQTHKNQNRN